MKITKRQLRRIIKEEKQKLLNEAPRGIVAGLGFSIQEPSHNTRAHAGVSNQTPAALALKNSLRNANEGKIVAQAVGYNPIFAEWSPDGLTMEITQANGGTIKFSRQKDVEALITMLEELLAGPMRTSP
jgi:hypothetical protein